MASSSAATRWKPPAIRWIEAASAIPRGSSAGAGLHCAAYASRAPWRSDRIELISLRRRSLLVALGVHAPVYRHRARGSSSAARGRRRFRPETAGTLELSRVSHAPSRRARNQVSECSPLTSAGFQRCFGGGSAIRPFPPKLGADDLP